jgi:hypothetical protein
MRDDLEQLLRRIVDRVPGPPVEATDRVRESVMQCALPRPTSSRQGALLVAAIFMLVGLAAFGAGYWTGPTQAAADLTIGVRPETVPVQLSTTVTLFGSVPSGRAGESVDVEANECGLSGHYHELEGVRTEAQGVWSLPVPHYTPGVRNNNSNWVTTKTSFRVRWNNRASESVTVIARPGVFIQQLPAKRKVPGKRRFQILVVAPQIKYRPRVVVERRVGETWKRVARVVVPLSATRTHSLSLWLRASKGHVLRARLPASEAAPCYPAEIGDPARPVD